jgi:hypothetical protein
MNYLWMGSLVLKKPITLVVGGHDFCSVYAPVLFRLAAARKPRKRTVDFNLFYFLYNCTRANSLLARLGTLGRALPAQARNGFLQTDAGGGGRCGVRSWKTGKAHFQGMWISLEIRRACGTVLGYRHSAIIRAQTMVCCMKIFNTILRTAVYYGLFEAVCFRYYADG